MDNYKKMTESWVESFSSNVGWMMVDLKVNNINFQKIVDDESSLVGIGMEVRLKIQILKIMSFVEILEIIRFGIELIFFRFTAEK